MYNAQAQSGNAQQEPNPGGNPNSQQGGGVTDVDFEEVK
jgi:hypothetical protein